MSGGWEFNVRRLWLVPILAVVILSIASCSDDSTPNEPTTGEAAKAAPTAEPFGVVGVILTEEDFRSLLTLQEVEGVLKEKLTLKESQFIDIKKLTDERGAQQTFPMDSGYSIFYVNEDESKSVKLGVFDLESLVAASNQYAEVKDLTHPDMEIMDPPIGHASAQMVANANGIGSNVVFLVSDLLVTLHTGMPDGTEPLTDQAGLRELAKLIEGRLRRN
jgi:hypothetical protein